MESLDPTVWALSMDSGRGPYFKWYVVFVAPTYYQGILDWTLRSDTKWSSLDSSHIGLKQGNATRNDPRDSRGAF